MADAKTKQYDRFRASKEVLKEVRKTAAGNLTSKLNTQGAVIRYVWSEVLQSSKNAWFAVQGNLSRNLHNFTVRYLNNTLPHLSNMFTGDWLKQNCAHCAITFSLRCMQLLAARYHLIDTPGGTIQF